MEQFQTPPHESWEEAWNVVPGQCLHESSKVQLLCSLLGYSELWT